ncbi:STAS domain-containing protein [Streptomyces sviceus]|uniref:STAS domain-containing protein n=1 Tax=Streptomyces sviceus TaxID=285530 RepID=UPI00381BA7FC
MVCRAGFRTGLGLPPPNVCPCREHAQVAGTPAPPEPLPDGLLNRGVMPLPQLIVCRHSRRTRTLITLVGETDPESASLDGCLRDGIRTIDVDLALVTFCDRSGLNTFLHAAQQTTAAGGTLRLHRPPPMLTRIVRLADRGFVLPGSQFVPPPPSVGDSPAGPLPTPPHRSVPRAPDLSGDVR